MTLRTETIGYQHDGVALEGLLAWDDAIQGPRPGVLVSHAWAGRSEFEDSKAQKLAELGYAGFSLDLYGKGVRGSSKEENTALMQPFMENRPLLQERLNASLDAMNDCEVVDATRSAIIGYCFGGLCALDLARSGRDIRSGHQPARSADGTRQHSRNQGKGTGTAWLG